MPHAVRRMADIWDQFPPVMRHFFYERFREPATWFERRLAYTRSVAVNSMAGELTRRHSAAGHGMHRHLRHAAYRCLDDKTPRLCMI